LIIPVLQVKYINTMIMAKYSKKAQDKIEQVMHEFKTGKH
jgi:hypothetical protein